MNPTDLVEEILDQPNAQQLVNKVQRALHKESKERLDFREWLTDDIKAEFINGAIVLHSPVKRGHLNASNNLCLLLTVYTRIHQLGEVSTEKALIGLTRNDYEPDICFWTKEQAANFDDDTMIHPAPSLIVEVLSKGTKSKDRGVKFKDYASHGVPEYWMIDYKKKTVEQYALMDEKATTYTLLHKLTVTDKLESQIILGFRIPVAAIFDDRENLKALEGLMQGK